MTSKEEGRKKGGKPSGKKKETPFPVKQILEWLEPWADRFQENSKSFAGRVRMSVPSVSKWKSGDPGSKPTPAQIADMARRLRVPVATLFENYPGYLYEREGLRFQCAGDARQGRELSLREVAIGTLLGEPEAALLQRLEAIRWFTRVRLGAEKLRWMARSGLALGLVELVDPRTEFWVEDEDRPEQPFAFESPDLARQLEDRCEEDTGRRPSVRVVKNFSHPSLRPDPVAPFLIARVAQHLVARFLEERERYTVGIAGGIHVATFVRTIGPATCPFPRGAHDERKLEFVPLTLEPFSNHRFDLANALVGELSARAISFLGPVRVEALAVAPFGLLVDREMRPLRADSVTHIRGRYNTLDVAIFGCGDDRPGGWLQETLESLGLNPAPPAVTDACMNLLTAEGKRVPLGSAGETREFLGIGLRTLQNLAAPSESEAPEQNKLVVLLTSGARKGLSIATILRAGCCNTIVCDEEAAHATLAQPRRKGPHDPAASRGDRAA